MNKTTKTILSWTITIGACLGMWWCVNTTGTHIGIVKSGSMTPTLNVKDAVIGIGPQIKPPQIGDVIIAQPTLGKEKLPPTVHRIVEKNEKGWITKGDNNPSVDPWYVTENDIDAVMVTTLPLSKITINPGLIGILLTIGAVLYLWPKTNENDTDNIENVDNDISEKSKQTQNN